MRERLKGLLVLMFVLSLAVAGCSAKSASNETKENDQPVGRQETVVGEKNTDIQPVGEDNSPDESGYKHQKDFYTHQILNGKTEITPNVILFFHDYFSKNSNELRLLPEFSPGTPPGWSELSDFLVANIDEWPDDMLLTGEQFKTYMKRYFADARYTPSWYGPQYKDEKYVFSGGFDVLGTFLYEITSLEKGRTKDGKDKWKAHIKGYYFGESDDTAEDYGNQSDNAKAVRAEMKKKENTGLTFRQVKESLVLKDPDSILDVTSEWTIEFMVNNPTEECYFTYLSCSRGPDNGQKLPQKPQPQLLVFNRYPSGYDFIESIADRRGHVEITVEMRKKFNLFARDYRWCYMPDMDGYESFFDTKRYADSFGYSNFADAVLYMMSYLRFPEKVSAKAMENAIQTLFVAKNYNHQDMPHQAYPKIANYKDGYYSPWPEGTPDYNRMFFLLTNLDIEEQESGEVYITIRAKQYYFEHPSYEPGENEKWLAKKANELGLPDLQAAAKLIADNKMDGMEGTVEYETTMVYNMKYTSPYDYAPRFIFSRSRSIQYDQPFAD